MAVLSLLCKVLSSLNRSILPRSMWLEASTRTRGFFKRNGMLYAVFIQIPHFQHKSSCWVLETCLVCSFEPIGLAQDAEKSPEKG